MSDRKIFHTFHFKDNKYGIPLKKNKETTLKDIVKVNSEKHLVNFSWACGQSPDCQKKITNSYYITFAS